MSDFRLVEFAYLPDGFVALENDKEYILVDTNKLVAFKSPKLTEETVFESQFESLPKLKWLTDGTK